MQIRRENGGYTFYFYTNGLNENAGAKVHLTIELLRDALDNQDILS